MILLAIDTSSEFSGLALYHQHSLLAQIQWASARRHSEQLLPQLDALCRLANITPPQITTVAVSLGPGSWSGVRVGISMAKGLALANDAHIIGVSALDVLAWPWRDVCAITTCLALGRGRYAIAHYPATPWHPGTIQPHNVTIPQLATLDATTICCAPFVWDQIQATCPPHIIYRPAITPPTLIAHIAFALDTTLTQLIEPLYLGDAVITNP
jgi:tRNA threonylcarbamoyladenosine biosynthesis protein TsaB